MADPLLVVEDAFTTRGPGVLVMPRFTSTTKEPVNVRLERPDGSSFDTHATSELAHMRCPAGSCAMYRIHGVTVEDLPAGTKIFAR